MIGSMTRLKIAITLPEEQVATARQAVAELLRRGEELGAFPGRVELDFVS